MTQSSVDDSDEFRRLIRTFYHKFDKFMEDFRNYQLETCTQFYIYNSRTREAWAKEHRKQLPEGCPYFFVKFCCVHRRRKSSNGREGIRYKNYDCEAQVTVRLINGVYRIVKWSMVHSHSFQVGNPSIYVKNRRLTPEQESQVYELMGSMNNCRVLQEYAMTTFGRCLTRQDLKSIHIRQSRSGVGDKASAVRKSVAKKRGRKRKTDKTCLMPETAPLCDDTDINGTFNESNVAKIKTFRVRLDGSSGSAHPIVEITTPSNEQASASSAGVATVNISSTGESPLVLGSTYDENMAIIEDNWDQYYLLD